jgi:hypothetical protein
VRQGCEPDRLQPGRRRQAAEYGAEDSDLLPALHALLPADRRRRGAARIYGEIEMPVREVLYRMERNGVLIDAALLAQQSHELGKRLMELEQQAHELAGQPFNVNSPKQLAEILFTKLGLPVKKKTPSGTPSTDEEVLSELALDYPLPKVLLESRQLAKLKSTYTDKLPRWSMPQTGRVHTSYSQAVAVTGRLAQRPQPAEHPGAHRRRPPHPRRPSSPRRAAASFRPTTRRSSCASWRTSRKTSACSKPSRKARMCTAPPPPKSSASRRSRSAPTSAALPRSSTSA